MGSFLITNILFIIIYLFSLHATIITTPVAAFNTSTNAPTKHGHHKWVGPSGHRLITVDLDDGFADFRSVQDAVDAVPENNRKNVLILINAGCYMYVILIHRISALSTNYFI